MARTTGKLKVYLEVGQKRTIAAALDWPGWCRVGRDEESALRSLFDYGQRYGIVLRSARLGFHAPKDASAFVVTEVLKGNFTTDYGSPDIPPKSDARPISDAEMKRMQAVLRACWRAFDSTAETARGKPLRAGPRGGGRTVKGIVEHVLSAEQAYLSTLGGKAAKGASVEQLREVILETMVASGRGEVAKIGPRGGKRWPARFFVRRAAWHLLDHAWEIEDRSHN